MPKVLKAYPPNYAEICKAIPAVKQRPGIVFTYYPNIYHPSGTGLSYDLEKHEAVHLNQQEILGPERWWTQYLADPKFRLDQEIEAYRAQYKAAEIYNRAKRRELLIKIRTDLASPMYGKLISKLEAEKAITE